jgi:protein-disulfide isomerase
MLLVKLIKQKSVKMSKRFKIERKIKIMFNSTSKKDYFFGLVIGVAVMAVIGFFIMPSLSNQASDQTENTKTNPQESSSGVEVTKDDHIRGNFNAKVTIIEYSDFQCPFCEGFHKTMKQIVKDYPNDVRWVYKHFPLDSIHPLARPAAEASECAGEQDKFWKYTDQVFENQKGLTSGDLSDIAKDIGLDFDQFSQCLNSGKYVDKVEADYQEGLKNGVRGAPGNLINGKLVPGALPYESIKAVVESLL